MSDGTSYGLQELRDLIDHEHTERERLEGEVIGLGSKIDAGTTAVRELSGRLDRHVEATHRKLDRLMEHLGVPFEEKR